MLQDINSINLFTGMTVSLSEWQMSTQILIFFCAVCCFWNGADELNANPCSFMSV